MVNSAMGWRGWPRPRRFDSLRLTNSPSRNQQTHTPRKPFWNLEDDFDEFCLVPCADGVWNGEQ
ncbi:hypothetical protein DAI22_04g296250 [Oryza sativa Japonica Group]|nr:hypothetical protein DAI22_04g296250 [Oryza sativa Japonica Group]